MAEPTLPAPPLNSDSEPYYQAADESRFLIRRCTQCRRAHWYPRPRCPFCLGPTDWEEAEGRGTLYSFAVLRRGDAPFVTAYVQLAEGVAMMTALVDCDVDSIAIGDPVTVTFKRAENDRMVPCFRPSGPLS